tara:strand:+ start:2293 stop:2955 length:663 start_codon:yes stop_codon:yes gene_type:complete
MKYSTITATASSGIKDIDINTLRNYVENSKNPDIFVSLPNKPRLKKKNPEMKIKPFKNQLTIGMPRDVDGIKKNVSVKFYTNGTLHFTGCNSIPLIHCVIDDVLILLKEIGYSANNNKDVYLSISINMINTTFDVMYQINQRILTTILTDKYNILSIFNPKEYAGIKCVYYTKSGKKTSFLIFKSGKITVAGSKDEGTLIEGYNKIKTILETERSNVEIN